MRLLLDTHAVIWWVDQDHLVSASAHSAIADPQNELLLSAGTIWEIAIKVGLGRLSLSLPYRPWINKVVEDLRVTILPVTVEYADARASLPHHHKDPFDRLLVSQARVEGLQVVSADRSLDLYGIERLW